MKPVLPQGKFFVLIVTPYKSEKGETSMKFRALLLFGLFVMMLACAGPQTQQGSAPQNGNSSADPNRS
jgi:hypothetical protein